MTRHALLSHVALPGLLLFLAAGVCLGQPQAEDPADAQKAVAAERARLLATIQPPEARQSGELNVSEVALAISSILNDPSIDNSRVRVFGPSGAAALRWMIGTADLRALLARGPSNLLTALYDHFPSSGVAFLLEVEKGNLARYQVLVRGGFGPSGLLAHRELVGADLERLKGLMDRTLQQPELEQGPKLALVLDALGRDQSTAASTAYLIENLEAAASRVEKRSRKSFAKLVLERYEGRRADMPRAVVGTVIWETTDPGVLAATAKSRDVGVRVATGERVTDLMNRNGTDPRTLLPILLELLADPEASVQSQAQIGLSNFLSSTPEALTLDELQRVASAFGSGAAVGSTLASRFERAVVARLKTLTFAEEKQARQVLTTIQGSGQLVVQQKLRDELSKRWIAPAGAMAALSALVPDGQLTESTINQLVSKVTSQLREGPLAGSALGAQTQLRLLELLHAYPGIVTGGNLALIPGLEPELVPDALRWMGSFELGADKEMARSVVAWEGAEAAFLRAASDEALPPRARSLAVCGLLFDDRLSATDAGVVANALGQILREPKSREEFHTLLSLALAYTERPSSRHWALVVALLMEDGSLPNEAVSRLLIRTAAASAGEVDAIARVVDAVDVRRATGPGWTSSRTLGRVCLETGTDLKWDVDVLEGHQGLVLEWAEDWNMCDECVSYATARDAISIAVLSDSLISSLHRSDSEMPSRAFVNQILRFPDDPGVSSLLAVTRMKGDAKLVDYVEERVGKLLRVAELEQRWGSLSRGAVSTENAKLRVIEMLRDPRESVRLEAIRGVATLGAVEALPQLIEIVGGSSEVEAEAAREALATLHRRMAAVPIPGQEK